MQAEKKTEVFFFFFFFYKHSHGEYVSRIHSCRALVEEEEEKEEEGGVQMAGKLWSTQGTVLTLQSKSNLAMKEIEWCWRRRDACCSLKPP